MLLDLQQPQEVLAVEVLAQHLAILGLQLMVLTEQAEAVEEQAQIHR
jgi:hypothetical protein